MPYLWTTPTLFPIFIFRQPYLKLIIIKLVVAYCSYARFRFQWLSRYQGKKLTHFIPNFSLFCISGSCSPEAKAPQRYANEFEELEKIGKGGFSTVYKVRSRLDNRFYAVKKIKIKPSEYRTNLQEHFDKIMREGRLLSEITHPHVLKYHAIWFEVGSKVPSRPAPREPQPITDDSSFQMVFDSEDSQQNSDIGFAVEEVKETPRQAAQNNKKMEKNKSDDKQQRKQSDSYHSLFDYRSLNDFSDVTIYIQTELCKETLYDLVVKKMNKQQDTSDNCRIILQLIDGLDFIHSKKIIHRDLKLYNVLVDFNGNLKISDFGLAKKCRAFKSCFIVSDMQTDITEQDLEKFSSSVGTKIFSSPEQTTSSNYDHRTDIFSLGVVIGILYATWSTKHEEFDIINRLRNKTNLAELLPRMPPSLIEIVEKCVAADPQNRPSLKEIRMTLLRLMTPPSPSLLLRWPHQNSFKKYNVFIKGGVLYLGEADSQKFNRMIRTRNLQLKYREESVYDVYRESDLILSASLSEDVSVQQLRQYLK